MPLAIFISSFNHKYYRKVVEFNQNNTLGKKLSFFLGLIIALNQLGIIILYQVILYRLIGGVINEIRK